MARKTTARVQAFNCAKIAQLNHVLTHRANRLKSYVTYNITHSDVINALVKPEHQEIIREANVLCADSLRKDYPPTGATYIKFDGHTVCMQPNVSHPAILLPDYALKNDVPKDSGLYAKMKSVLDVTWGIQSNVNKTRDLIEHLGYAMQNVGQVLFHFQALNSLVGSDMPDIQRKFERATANPGTVPALSPERRQQCRDCSKFLSSLMLVPDKLNENKSPIVI